MNHRILVQPLGSPQYEVVVTAKTARRPVGEEVFRNIQYGGKKAVIIIKVMIIGE